MKTLSDKDYDTLYAFCMQYVDNDNQSAFPAMTYEDGVQAVLDVLEGNSTAEEAAGK